MLENKVAVVTGAARGIGRAIALGLAAKGATVIINCSSSLEQAKEVVRQIEKDGGQSQAIKGDVSDATSVAAMFDEVIEKYGKIDILVNNAGITRDNLLMRMSEEDFDAVIDINLKGAFLCSKAVIKAMMKQRSGRIINISSVSGVAGNAGQANYSAAKAGMLGLTKAVAREVASRGITVNAIAPGFIKTDMTEKLSDKIKEAVTSNIPLGHFGEPEDIAQAVVFLSSDAGRYITGQTINIDGGMCT